MLTLPNILTLGRLALVPWFLMASYREQWKLALIIFISAAITDVLDGFLARRMNLRSRLGAVLDPAADKILMICGFLFYTLHGSPAVRLPAWLTFTVFIRDFLIVVFAYLLYTRVQVKRFPPSWAGKASTVTQAVTLAATIAVNAFAPGPTRVLEVLFRLALVITLFSGWDYMRRGKGLLEGTPGEAI
ncbi:MAG TPA: CDP-alcohol phosphatidyltransferase family protein [Thermoanaerobaculia bacterium]|jgi:cardiolipin synthase